MTGVYIGAIGILLLVWPRSEKAPQNKTRHMVKGGKTAKGWPVSSLSVDVSPCLRERCVAIANMICAGTSTTQDTLISHDPPSTKLLDLQ